MGLWRRLDVSPLGHGVLWTPRQRKKATQESSENGRMGGGTREMRCAERFDLLPANRYLDFGMHAQVASKTAISAKRLRL